MTSSHRGKGASGGATPDWYRFGQLVSPGIYAYRGEWHVDEREFILATGGDPDSEADREAARRAVEQVGRERGIPTERR